jgi:hypothetical protein
MTVCAQGNRLGAATGRRLMMQPFVLASPARQRRGQVTTPQQVARPWLVHSRCDAWEQGVAPTRQNHRFPVDAHGAMWCATTVLTVRRSGGAMRDAAKVGGGVRARCRPLAFPQRTPHAISRLWRENALSVESRFRLFIARLAACASEVRDVPGTDSGWIPVLLRARRAVGPERSPCGGGLRRRRRCRTFRIAPPVRGRESERH